MIPRRAALPIAVLIFVAVLVSLYLALAGTVIVNDPAGQVARAFIANDRGEQKLHRLPGGYFVGVPGLEGSAAIVCRDGSRHAFGYVTGGIHTRVEVRPGCRLADG